MRACGGGLVFANWAMPCIWSAPGAPSVSLPDLHISRARVFMDRRLHVDHPGDLQYLRADVRGHERLSMRASAPVRV